MPIPNPLLAKFERALALTEQERHAISFVPLRLQTVRADQAILREGTQPKRCCLLIEGLSCSAKIVSNGNRQIVAFHIPGDMPDLNSFHLETRDTDVWAITTCEVAFIDHHDLRQLCEEYPRLATELWRITLADAAVFREWVVNVGRRDGISRMAHLFCEIMKRMETIGRAKDGVCPFPVTQRDLAEATGMSEVHVNRMLQDLRREKLISFGRGQLTIHDWNKLAEQADFSIDYLHLPLAMAA